MPHTHRRRAITCIAALAITALGHGAHAQTAWPTKPIRLQVGFAPGSATDVVARAFATKLGTELGQQVIVENKAGAGGTLAATAVARAPADGYTLLMGEPGSLAVSPAQIQVPYQPAKDFIAVAQLVSLPMVLVATPASKITSLRALLAQAQREPMNFGTAGSGSMQHLTMMQFARETKTPFTHVGYKGGAPAVTDLLAGQIPLAMVTVPSVASFIKAGKIVPLAVVAPQRSALLPDTPTFTEEGYPNFVQDGWQGFFAPAGTPADVVQRLYTALAKVARDPELQSSLSATGAVIVVRAPADFDKTMQRDVAYWAKVVADNPAARD